MIVIIITACLASCGVAELVAGKTFVFEEALSVSYDDTVSDEQKEIVTVESMNKEKYGDMLLIIDMTYSGAVPVYSNIQIEI